MSRIWKKPSKTKYSAPAARAHRGFVYLDDDVVINSLSAIESGKVDEVVEKINLAQQAGMSVGIKGGPASLSGDASASESLQAEVIRRRTRFSIFELWYDQLGKKKALGTFDGWGADALQDVKPGDVVELRGTVSIVPIQTAFRMFLWYVNQVRNNNPMFKDKADLKALKDQEFIIKFLIGERDEINATMTPTGDAGPAVGVTFQKQWIIETIGRWNGVFTVVAQVEEVLGPDQSWETMRLIEDVPMTPLEESTLISAMAPFQTAVEGFGLELGDDTLELRGPALVLRPIALYR